MEVEKQAPVDRRLPQPSELDGVANPMLEKVLRLESWAKAVGTDREAEEREGYSRFSAEVEPIIRVEEVKWRESRARMLGRVAVS